VHTTAYSATKSVGIHKFTITYSGDANTKSATFTVNVIFYYFPTHGQYLIGSKAAVLNKTAVFYSPTWGSQNKFTNDQFLGYVANTGGALSASGSCGVKFNTPFSTGVNQTLPTYVGVFVVPQAPKIANSKVSGKTNQLAIIQLSKASTSVKVNAAAKGTVVALFCTSALPEFKL